MYASFRCRSLGVFCLSRNAGSVLHQRSVQVEGGWAGGCRMYRPPAGHRGGLGPPTVGRDGLHEGRFSVSGPMRMRVCGCEGGSEYDGTGGPLPKLWEKVWVLVGAAPIFAAGGGGGC